MGGAWRPEAPAPRHGLLPGRKERGLISLAKSEKMHMASSRGEGKLVQILAGDL